MKSAKVFLVGMYLHLLLSIVIPISIVVLGQKTGWNATNFGLFLFYLLEVFLIHILGWIVVGMAVAAYQQKNMEKLRKGVILLKFGSIPFYILNFLYSFFVWFCLVGASRGILIIFVPIPILFTCFMIVQSGCVGVNYIRLLREQPENKGKPSGIYSLLQIIPMLDVISTLVILKKYKS